MFSLKMIEKFYQFLQWETSTYKLEKVQSSPYLEKLQ